MKAIAVIPARLASTRLPRKMLREIAGKPLIGVVYEAVRSSPLLAEVIIATDSDEIMRRLPPTRLEGQHDFGHASQRNRASARNFRPRVCRRLHQRPGRRTSRPPGANRDIAAGHGESRQHKSEHSMTPRPPIDISESECRQSSHGSQWPRPVFFPRHHPFRSRQLQPALLQTPGSLCLSQTGAGPLREPARISLEKSERLEQLRFLENGIPIYVGRDAA